jgi:hypothetical protein
MYSSNFDTVSRLRVVFILVSPIFIPLSQRLFLTSYYSYPADRLDPKKLELSSSSIFYYARLSVKSILRRHCFPGDGQTDWSCWHFLLCMASDMPLLRETCTIFYARNFFHFLLPRHFLNDSLFDFDNFGNIQSIHDGEFGGSTTAFSGCLPPQGK